MKSFRASLMLLAALAGYSPGVAACGFAEEVRRSVPSSVDLAKLERGCQAQIGMLKLDTWAQSMEKVRKEAAAEASRHAASHGG